AARGAGTTGRRGPARPARPAKSPRRAGPMLRTAGWSGALLAGRVCGAQKQDAPVRVVLQTELGEIEVELGPAKAPATTANFLRYVERKFYDGGAFHRTVRADNQPRDKVRIGVVQAGI